LHVFYLYENDNFNVKNKLKPITMNYGKEVCKILKDIRREIADKNDIELVTSECHFHGECQGTCPKCEAEVRYLEQELHRRKQLGKVATIAGLSLGIAATLSACERPIEGDPMPTGIAPPEWVDENSAPENNLISTDRIEQE
jgi:hypothetical protein